MNVGGDQWENELGEMLDVTFYLLMFLLRFWLWKCFEPLNSPPTVLGHVLISYLSCACSPKPENMKGKSHAHHFKDGYLLDARMNPTFFI